MFRKSSMGFGRSLALVCLLGSLATVVVAAEVVLEETTPVWPDKVALVYPDGTRGPWMDFKMPNGPKSAAEFAPIWDSYEADPELWNAEDNEACEVYDVPPDSGNFCLGECDGRRYVWRGDVEDRAPSCISANGGDLAKDGAGKDIAVSTILWGAVLDAEPLQIEVTLFPTYDGSGCSDPGSGDPVGFILGFESAGNGFFRTTVDHVANEIEVTVPDGGRMGIQMRFWKDRENEEPSERTFPGLWVTKTGWEDVMGKDDEAGYSDYHEQNKNDCKLEGRCVNGGAICPNGDTLVGLAALFLTGGEADTCLYKLKKNSKAKKKCPKDACPKKNDVVSSGKECDNVNRCPKKLRLKKIDCPEGEKGFCKKIKGKRSACGQP